MPNAIGYHYVHSAYGRWLPGDVRGSWSETWDQQIGFTQPHTLHEGDPVRLRMAKERRKRPAVRWSAEIWLAIAGAVETCAAASDWSIAGFAIEETQLHLAVTPTSHDIDGTAKWLGQQMTKAVHTATAHTGPVFYKNHWLQFIYELDHWDRLLAYIGRHNKAADGIGGPPNGIDDFIRAMDGCEDRG